MNSIGKEQSLEQMVLGQLDFHMQKNEVGFYHTVCTKISSRWIKDLKVRAKTIRHLEENVGVNLHDLGSGNAFLDMYDTHSTRKEKIIKLDHKRLSCIKVHYQ